jgi:hypothetical protein
MDYLSRMRGWTTYFRTGFQGFTVGIRPVEYPNGPVQSSLPGVIGNERIRLPVT